MVAVSDYIWICECVDIYYIRNMSLANYNMINLGMLFFGNIEMIKFDVIYYHASRLFEIDQPYTIGDNGLMKAELTECRRYLFTLRFKNVFGVKSRAFIVYFFKLRRRRHCLPCTFFQLKMLVLSSQIHIFCVSASRIYAELSISVFLYLLLIYPRLLLYYWS